jgi:hypothetical protein
MDDEARNTIEGFHEAFDRRDLGALGDLITDDCVFEAISPAPTGPATLGGRRCWRRGGPSSQTRQPRILKWRTCSALVIGSSSGGFTAGRTGMSAVPTCCGSGLGGWRRAWPTSRADRVRRLGGARRVPSMRRHSRTLGEAGGIPRRLQDRRAINVPLPGSAELSHDYSRTTTWPGQRGPQRLDTRFASRGQGSSPLSSTSGRATPSAPHLRRPGSLLRCERRPFTCREPRPLTTSHGCQAIL